MTKSGRDIRLLENGVLIFFPELARDCKVRVTQE